MLTLSDNTVQVKNDLYELDCAILNHPNILYYMEKIEQLLLNYKRKKID